MTALARGDFVPTLVPYPEATAAAPRPVGRLSIRKSFTGDLVGTSDGEMLTGMTPTEGSAGYVALERVEGRLAGRSGTFLLQHFGVMNRGEPRLELIVVPDSGTGDLTGLSGSMTIAIDGDRHAYELSYELAPSAAPPAEGSRDPA